MQSQGGFHELHNEPNGVKEELLEEIVAFIDAHLPAKKDTPIAIQQSKM